MGPEEKDLRKAKREAALAVIKNNGNIAGKDEARAILLDVKTPMEKRKDAKDIKEKFDALLPISSPSKSEKKKAASALIAKDLMDQILADDDPKIRQKKT